MELDSALEQLGHWGKFQLINYSLLCVPIVFHAVFYLTYVFTAKDVDHRCFIPECESNPTTTAFDPPWLREAVPYKEDVFDRCNRYIPIEDAENNGTCSASLFIKNTTKCDKWVYRENGASIVSEWDMACNDNSHWKLTLVGTVNNMGRFFGMPIAGFVSDRYGRRTILLGGLFLAGIAGLIRSFAQNYIMFIAFEFIDPLCNAGLYSAGFILGMELIGPDKRVFWSAFTHSVYAGGEAILGLVAWVVQDWRWLLRAFYAPALLSVAALWVLPESVRWLVSKGRTKEARAIIRRAARINGVPAKQLGLEELKAAFVVNEKKAFKEETNDVIPPGALKQTLKSKILLLRLLNCSFCWMTNTFVYYGLSLHSVAVAGNQYLNFIMVCLIEVPAGLATYVMMEKVGRRASMCASLVLTGVSCIAFLFVPESMQWVSIATYLVGKFGITVSYSVLYVLTAEIFPTSVRHTLFAACSMIGRLGSIVAPQTPLLARYMKSLPVIMFGVMSLSSGLAALLFPETHGTKLPDSVKEAEDIGKHAARVKSRQTSEANLKGLEKKKSVISISGVQVTMPVVVEVPTTATTTAPSSTPTVQVVENGSNVKPVNDPDSVSVRL